MKSKQKLKGDLLLIAVLVIVGLGAVAYNKVVFPSRGRAGRVLIEIEGKVIQELDLSQDISPIRFETDYGYNIVEVENGRVRVSGADCPDQICVNTGWRRHAGQLIVCMPHHFVVKLVGSADSPLDLDSFTY